MYESDTKLLVQLLASSRLAVGIVEPLVYDVFLLDLTRLGDRQRGPLVSGNVVTVAFLAVDVEGDRAGFALLVADNGLPTSRGNRTMLLPAVGRQEDGPLEARIDCHLDERRFGAHLRPAVTFTTRGVVWLAIGTPLGDSDVVASAAWDSQREKRQTEGSP